uniref:Integrase catalytic domain-containing protein n=1 Tax=Trichogramma kaykai TaxID=54128 RepID=A0ABD2WNZ7_9HYME
MVKKTMSEHETVVYELHRPARRNYPRRKFNVRGIDETWQADLVEMLPYERENKGYKYLLTVIDTFSKYCWALPVKTKSGQDVATAMESIFQQGRTPKNFLTDHGKEFYNSHFENLMKKYNVYLYSTYSNLKASICERFNRTLKNKMWMKFSLQGNYKWLDMLLTPVTRYNDTVHRTIGLKLKDVTPENEKEILVKKFLSTTTSLKKRAKFKIGDKVFKLKNVFEKGYTLNWSAEIFTITRVVPTQPVTYHLKDYKDQPIAGGFYEHEIAKVKHPDIYLIEKVLKRRKNQMYVKWLGFDISVKQLDRRVRAPTIALTSGVPPKLLLLLFF